MRSATAFPAGHLRPVTLTARTPWGLRRKLARAEQLGYRHEPRDTAEAKVLARAKYGIPHSAPLTDEEARAHLRRQKALLNQ